MEFLSQKAINLHQGAIRAMFDRAAGMEHVISMGIGEPDLTTPELICRAGMEALRKGVTHYTPNAGTQSLRRAIAELSSLAPVSYDPDGEIIVTNGGMGALSLLFLVILESGDEVLIQDPQWLNYVAQVQYCGGRAVRVPTKAAEKFAMAPEEIEARITPRTKALMINSPNNPTGEILPLERLEQIATVAKKHDLLVISDEVYHTLSYTDERYHSIAELPGMKERTVVIDSFSKSYAMTGWRIGYAAGPRRIIDRMTKCQENFNACANAPGQYAAEAALHHPELCLEIREVFAERRKLMLEGLRQVPGIRCGNAEGTFYLFPDVRQYGLDSTAFCQQLLEEEQVVCIPGSAFGECGEGHIRMSYTSAEPQLLEALQRLARFCEKRICLPCNKKGF